MWNSIWSGIKSIGTSIGNTVGNWISGGGNNSASAVMSFPVGQNVPSGVNSKPNTYPGFNSPSGTTSTLSYPSVASGNAAFMANNPQYGYNGAPNPVSFRVSPTSISSGGSGTTQVGASYPSYESSVAVTPVNYSIGASNLANASQGNGVGTTAAITPSAPSSRNYTGNIVQNNVNANLNPDGTAKVTSVTGQPVKGDNGYGVNPDGTPKTASQARLDLIMKQFEAAKKPASEAEQYNRALQQSGEAQAQQMVNNLQTQVGAINARIQTDLQSLRGVGAKEGVTEAVYGQQVAAITREGNLQLLPLQAQLAVAQNNLDVAKQNTQQLFKIYAEDAQNSVDFYNKQVNALFEAEISDLTAKEKQQLEDIKLAKQNNFEVFKSRLDSYESAANAALARGDTATYNAITSALNKTNPDVNSPTFAQDNQRVFGGISNTLAQAGYTPQTTTSDSAIVNAMVNVNAGSAEGQQKRDAAQVAQFVKAGKLKEAKQLILSRVTSKMSTTEREAELDRRNTIDALTDMKSALNDYVSKSGDTNILTGSIENAANKIGTSKDPELAAIKTRIVQATQKYRNSITGAAWGEQETAEYKTLFPSITNTNKLNSTIIDTMIPLLQNNERNAIGLFLGGSDVYDSVFGTPTTETQNTPVSEEQQLLNAGYTQEQIDQLKSAK